MIKKIKSLIIEKKSVIIYLSVGTFTNLLDIVLYAILINFGIYFLLASTISTFIALSLNFSLHRMFTFTADGNVYGQVGRFLVGITFNYLISQLILLLFVSVLGVDELISKVLSIFIVIAYNYFLLKKWVFKL